MKKIITILGAGESGVGAAILAKKQKFDVFVSDFGKIQSKYKKVLDKNQIEYEEKKHSFDKILNSDEIIVSPGIPDNAEVIKKINEKKIKIISEIEFASRYTDSKKICITGSNGKTTTTYLIYEIFRNAGLNVGLAGNVGFSFAKQVAEKKYDYYIIELSSFQLDRMYEFRADVAILLNITPDHLDRYENKLKNYINSKFRIFQNQTFNDIIIYSVDDELIITEMKSKNFKQNKFRFSIKKLLKNGAFIQNNQININTNNNTMQILTQELSLKGKHNIYNSMAAAITASAENIKNETIRKTLMNFKGVEHRLEKYLTIRKVHFINDSKATNVNSVWYALESMDTDVVLILGGVDKGNDYSLLYDLVSEKVTTIIALGKDNTPIINAFGKMVEIIETKTMQEAVREAYIKAKKNDTVLLSPACASFDLFENYIDRGEQFKETVRNL